MTSGKISRGIHPAILSRGGLAAALRTIARRCAVPVELDVKEGVALPECVEVAGYYVVAEALTNVVKHADASFVRIELVSDDTTVALAVHDDGAGGADPKRGSGLIGLIDRFEAIGGTMSITSRAGSGTTVLARFSIGGAL